MTAYAYHNKLSGYLSLRDFSLNRLARLYPLFIFGWILGFINLFAKISSGQTNYNYFDGAVSMAVNLLWLPYINSHSVDIVLEKTVGAVFPGNDPAWTLALIFWSSLLYAYLVTRQKRIGIYIITFISAVALFLFVRKTYMAGPGWGSDNFFGGVVRTLFNFLGGTILYLYWRHIKPYVPIIKHAQIILPLALLLLLAIPNFPGYYIFWLLTVYTAVPVMVALAIAAPVESKRIEQICTQLGKLSYPIYCIHYPIFSIYSTTKSNTNIGPLELLGLITFILVTAYLLIRFYDDPLSAWSKKKGIR